MFRSITIHSALLWLLGVGVTSLANASPVYSTTDLGTLGGPTFALAINNSGQLSGHSFNSIVGQNRAFLYSDGTMIDLGTLGGLRSVANGINDAGQVAGTSQNSSVDAQAIVWSNGTATDLGTLGGSRKNLL